VELRRGNAGVVVCSIDPKEDSAACPREAWEHLGAGIVMLSEAAVLIHDNEPESTMRLRSRQAGN
jgi:hypothetical protein